MRWRLCSLLLATQVGIACAESETSDDTHTEGLRLELSVADSPILQHEPLVVVVRLTNVSGESVELVPRFEDIYSALKFNISDPYGRSFSHRWIAHADGTASWRGLAPGASMVHRQWLLFGTRRHEYFEFPGEYRIDASFTTPLKGRPVVTLKSGPVVFHVERVPASEVDAWDFFRGLARTAMGTSPEPMDWTRIVHDLDGIPHNYPESRYAPWCLFFLGRGWQLRQWKYEDRAKREAVTAFEKLLADYPDFPMSVETSYYLAKAQYEIDPTLENLEIIQTLIHQHSNLWLMQLATEQIDIRKAHAGVDPSQPVSLP